MQSLDCAGGDKRPSPLSFPLPLFHFNLKVIEHEWMVVPFIEAPFYVRLNQPIIIFVIILIFFVIKLITGSSKTVAAINFCMKIVEDYPDCLWRVCIAAERSLCMLTAFPPERRQLASVAGARRGEGPGDGERRRLSHLRVVY